MSAENTIQDLVTARLQTNAYFTAPVAIPMLTIDLGDIGNQIDQSVDVYTSGILMTILMPYGENPEPMVSSANLLCELMVTVCEIPIINRSGSGTNKPGYQVIRKAINQLHNWKPAPPYDRLRFMRYNEGQIPQAKDEKDRPTPNTLLFTAWFHFRESIL